MLKFLILAMTLKVSIYYLILYIILLIENSLKFKFQINVWVGKWYVINIFLMNIDCKNNDL